MNQAERTEGNKLIAEFMGFKIMDDSRVLKYIDPSYEPKKYLGKHKNIHTQIWGDQLVFLLERAKYHSSWDWLMPVVEKAQLYWEDKNNYFKKSENEARTILNLKIGAPIEKVWESLIIFIKWYNQQKEKI